MKSLTFILRNVYLISPVQADGYQTYSGDQFVIYINAESLCCIPETNIVLYVNYTSVKKNKMKKKISPVQEISQVDNQGTLIQNHKYV